MVSDQVVGEGRAEGEDSEHVVVSGGPRGRQPPFRKCFFTPQATPKHPCLGPVDTGQPELLKAMTDMFMSGVMPLSHGEYPHCLGCQIVSVFYNYDERSEE